MDDAFIAITPKSIPLEPGVGVPVRVPSLSQIELFKNLSVGKQTVDIKLFVLRSDT